MSYIGDYFRSKELDKREMSWWKIRWILSKFQFFNWWKEQIEYNIKSSYGWERTSNGFEYRNNFRFDESGKEILFDRYFVTKSKDKFESDGSEISYDF